jgi:hypothetical protein
MRTRFAIDQAADPERFWQIYRSTIVVPQGRPAVKPDAKRMRLR